MWPRMQHVPVFVPQAVCRMSSLLGPQVVISRSKCEPLCSLQLAQVYKEKCISPGAILAPRRRTMPMTQSIEPLRSGLLEYLAADQRQDREHGGHFLDPCT